MHPTREEAEQAENILELQWQFVPNSGENMSQRQAQSPSRRPLSEPAACPRMGACARLRYLLSWACQGTSSMTEETPSVKKELQLLWSTAASASLFIHNSHPPSVADDLTHTPTAPTPQPDSFCVHPFLCDETDQLTTTEALSVKLPWEWGEVRAGNTNRSKKDFH